MRRLFGFFYGCIVNLAMIAFLFVVGNFMLYNFAATRVRFEQYVAAIDPIYAPVWGIFAMIFAIIMIFVTIHLIRVDYMALLSGTPKPVKAPPAPASPPTSAEVDQARDAALRVGGHQPTSAPRGGSSGQHPAPPSGGSGVRLAADIPVKGTRDGW